MRNYEAMIILRPDMEEEARNTLVEKIQDIIVKGGGEIRETAHWGQRRLAYEIQKLRDGYYILVKFTDKGENIRELERNLNIMDNILRFLVVREGE